MALTSMFNEESEWRDGICCNSGGVHWRWMNCAQQRLVLVPASLFFFSSCHPGWFSRWRSLFILYFFHTSCLSLNGVYVHHSRYSIAFAVDFTSSTALSSSFTHLRLYLCSLLSSFHFKKALYIPHAPFSFSATSLLLCTLPFFNSFDFIICSQLPLSLSPRLLLYLVTLPQHHFDQSTGYPRHQTDTPTTTSPILFSNYIQPSSRD